MMKKTIHEKELSTLFYSKNAWPFFNPSKYKKKSGWVPQVEETRNPKTALFHKAFAPVRRPMNKCILKQQLRVAPTVPGNHGTPKLWGPLCLFPPRLQTEILLPSLHRSLIH